MSKFNVGDKIFIFNSISCRFEEDTVYGILFVPITEDGVEAHLEKSIKERIDSGEMKVHEQYQTLQHQIIDSSVAFHSEDEAKNFYLKLLSV